MMEVLLLKSQCTSNCDKKIGPVFMIGLIVSKQEMMDIIAVNYGQLYQLDFFVEHETKCTRKLRD